MACTLNDNCTWVRSTSVSTVRYDLWLVNGNPLVNAGDPLSKQFSFDEQTMPEMYFCALAAYIILASIQAKGISVSKHRRMPPRQRTLTWIIGLELTGLFFESVNALIFAAAGRGVGLFSFTGELCIVLATCLLCLLLILLSRGWSLNTSASDAYNSIMHYVWLLVSGVHVGFFVHNYFFTEGVPKRVDFYKSWAGYGIVGVRLLQALWFLFEVKRTIRRELNESRAIFLANFGAAYMVWFVYLVGLGAIAGFISDLWRLKVILAITTFANFISIACLVHIFWPTGSYRKFFIGDNSMHRQMERHSSTEMDEFERMLIGQDTVDSEPDNME
ncbi:antigen [Aphelenchoides avenae]|nr:antigen [Aphelenchus avenae]